MSLQTPEKIRSLQRKLYCKAKAEPAFRFYVLYEDFVEVFRQIGVNHVGVAPADQPVHFLDRIGPTATGPIAAISCTMQPSTTCAKSSPADEPSCRCHADQDAHETFVDCGNMKAALRSAKGGFPGYCRARRVRRYSV